jgi:hypothetical protein
LPALAKIVAIRYQGGMMARARRRWAPIVAGFAALGVIGAIGFAVSSPEAKRNARVIELIRSACEHSGLSHTALERLVRQNRDAAQDQEHAVRTLVAYCQPNR